MQYNCLIINVLSVNFKKLTYTKVSNDKNADDFAKLLSASLSNADMKDYIINAAREDFDGDSNFLITEKISDSSVKSASSFYTLLKNQYFTKSYNIEALDLDKIISEIQNYDPLLQIYLMNEELWDAECSPIVVWLPEDFDESVPCILTGYDMNGTKLCLPSDKEITDKPVVVISRNERVEVIEKDKADSKGLYLGARPYYSSNKYNYYLKEDLSYPSEIIATYDLKDLTKATTILTDEETALAWGGDYAICDRYDSYPTVEHIELVSIVDKDAWKKLESGWNGEPDLKVFVIHAVKTLTAINIIADKKHIGKGYGNRNNIVWKQVRLPLYLWSLATYGNAMKYEWFDEDSGKVINAGTTFTTQFYNYGTLPEQYVSMDILKRDEYAGGAYVYYWQDWCKEYRSDCVRFEIQSKK